MEYNAKVFKASNDFDVRETEDGGLYIGNLHIGPESTKALREYFGAVDTRP